ncbi:UNVERIFIED_CONTAM: hypothetical protein K2H54_023586 [Gekko kuhli]
MWKPWKLGVAQTVLCVLTYCSIQSRTEDPAMAEKYPAPGNSANEKPVLLSPCSSSSEPSLSGGPSELQPYSRSRVSSPSNQSSVVVPVRLDVLLFLLNSAARGAHYALPPESVQGGQGSPSTCHHCPAAQRVPNCCGCSSTCHSASQPSGTHQYGGDYGRGVGATVSHDNRHVRDVSGHRRDGKGWPNASSTGDWKVPQSPMGWQDKPQGEGRGRDNGDNWQGRRQGFGRTWGDRRHGAGDSASWRSGSQDWRKEGSTFGSNYTNNKRTQEGGPRPPWDAPDAKRPMGNARVDWPKGQGTKEPIRFPDKPADDGRGKPAIQENEEDWETDYERDQTSSATPGTVSHSSPSDVPADLSKEENCASAADPPKPSALTSPLLESAFKAQTVVAAPGKPPVPSCADQSKNGGFVAYLKNLYSDLPKKSSSEGSSDLVIDTDVESSKPDEEEQAPENEAGRELKSWE